MGNRLSRTARIPPRAVAISEAMGVTVIWASSFPLMKIVLDYAGPLTVAALRPLVAFLLLLPLLLRRRKALHALPRSLWLRMFLLGMSSYVLGNGALFWGLKYISASTASFLMGIAPLLVVFAGSVWLREVPTRWQVVGVVLALFGSLLFFSPGLAPGQPLGVAIVVVGLLGFTAFGLLTRGIARDQAIDTLTLTVVPLIFGGGALLPVALLAEGLPNLPLTAWGIVLYLGIVNTALGYTLYNHSLQTLTALEMNVILNLTPLGTALLAWLMLGETLASIQIIGMVTMIAGVLLVQQTRAHQEPGASTGVA